MLINLSKQSADFKEPYIPDSETNTDEWYLDSIAVDPNFQGRGIGSKLLAAVPRMALNDGKLVVGLNVDLENPEAEKLYARKGFKTVGMQMIGDHDYHHMQMPVLNRKLMSV